MLLQIRPSHDLAPCSPHTYQYSMHLLPYVHTLYTPFPHCPKQRLYMCTKCACVEGAGVDWNPATVSKIISGSPRLGPIVLLQCQTAKELANAVIPNEYGIDPSGKLRIGSKICSSLLGKILADLANMRDESLATVNTQVSPTNPHKHDRWGQFGGAEYHAEAILQYLFTHSLIWQSHVIGSLIGSLYPTLA